MVQTELVSFLKLHGNEEFHPAKSDYLNYVIPVIYMGTSLQ